MNCETILTEYVILTEAALMLNVSRITVRKWVKEQKLRGDRFGKVMLIPKSDVEKLLKDRTFKAKGWDV